LDQVFFGATVTYAHERGTERTVTIVGVDEADLDRGQVSWVSPIARALMKTRDGDILEVRTLLGLSVLKFSTSAIAAPMETSSTEYAARSRASGVIV
jgi:transcription elongation factor GreB